MLFSKFSRVIFNSSIRINSVFDLQTKKSIFKCTNFIVPKRNVHNTNYVLQKISPKQNPRSKKPEDISSQSIGYYSMAVVVLCGGLTFAAVPLYRLFCQVGKI